MTFLGFKLNLSRAAQNPPPITGEPHAVQKALSSDAEAWLRGEDIGGGAILSNAYEQVVWVYRAINVLAEQVANVPFLFSAGERGRENLITSGPLLDFYSRPHPQISRFQYWELRIIWLMLRGECFRVPIYQDPTGGLSTARTQKSKLKKILILDPSRFQHIVEDHQLIGWRYTGFGPRAPLASQVFLPEEVWFEKLPNPFDFWRGLPPLYIASMAAKTDFAASAFMQGIIENNCDTGVIVRTDKWLSDEQRQQIVSALTDRKRKAGVADRPVLLLGSAEVLKPQLSSSDLQFLENRKFSRSEICAAFGVPEEIVTTTEHAKYDVMAGARLNFIENRVAPLCCQLEAEEEVVVKSIDPRASGWFDLDSLPIMQEARRNRLAAARTGFEMGVPFNELNRVLDLGFRSLPWGDRGYISAKLQEVSTSQPGSKASLLSGKVGHPTGPAYSEPLTESSSESERSGESPSTVQIPAHPGSGPEPASGAFNVDDPFVRTERLFAQLRNPTPSPQLTSKIRRFLFEQRSRALAHLPSWLGAPKSAPSDQSVAPLLDLTKETLNFAAQLHPAIVSEFAAALSKVQPEAGVVSAASVESLAREYIKNRREHLGQINPLTLADLNQTLRNGLAQSEGLDELAKRVKEVFNAAGARARQIAQTESAAIFRAASETALNFDHAARGAGDTSQHSPTQTPIIS